MLLLEFEYGLLYIAIYFFICASAALLLKLLLGVKGELFRKLLHFILLGSLPVFVFAYEHWWLSALTALLFAAVIWPVLKLAEGFKAYSGLLEDRRGGEIKSSLLLVFSMFALVISVCWGWLDDRWMVLASVYAWGFGDAAAALVGKRHGKHHIKGGFVDGQKSLEGSLAMFSVSFISIIVILILRGGCALPFCFAAAAATAFVAAVTELCTPGGYDTITCPLAAMLVLLPIYLLWGGQM